jgi:hypothetical protein
MKFTLTTPLIFFFLLLFGTSCFKDPVSPPANTKIQFVLYTDQDFSTDSDQIVFRLSIQKAPNQTIWDSTLAPIYIKDIPDSAHKIVIEKSVSNDNNAFLKCGFYYSIENVGNSWYLDSIPPGVNFKKIEFNFR